MMMQLLVWRNPLYLIVLKYRGQKTVKIWRLIGFVCAIWCMFYDESKAREDKMFVLTHSFNLNQNLREIWPPK